MEKDTDLKSQDCFKRRRRLPYDLQVTRFKIAIVLPETIFVLRQCLFLVVLSQGRIHTKVWAYLVALKSKPEAINCIFFYQIPSEAPSPPPPPATPLLNCKCGIVNHQHQSLMSCYLWVVLFWQERDVIKRRKSFQVSHWMALGLVGWVSRSDTISRNLSDTCQHLKTSINCKESTVHDHDQ